MNRKRLTISITSGITVILLLIGGTVATSILLNTTHAQTATLGEPYFVEKGKIIGQKELGPNRTQFTISANGTLNGNIEVTNTGEIVTISKGNNLAVDQGQGVIGTTPLAPTITENNITITPAPEVNNTLIGRSTPTTSNTTLRTDNKTGEAEPLGGIK
jgi:hypothetical protein